MIWVILILAGSNLALSLTFLSQISKLREEVEKLKRVKKEVITNAVIQEDVNYDSMISDLVKQIPQ